MCTFGETPGAWFEPAGLTQRVAHVYVSQGGKVKCQLGRKLEWKSSRD